MKWCWILSKAFSASIEMIKWLLSLLLLMCYIIFIDLYMLNHPCITGDWSWWKSFWYVVAFGLPLLYREFWHRCSLKRLAYSSPFWICLCLVWDECNTGFIEWVRQCSFPLYFLEKFKENWY
jgi:hypothetical protein